LRELQGGEWEMVTDAGREDRESFEPDDELIKTKDFEFQVRR
jgi:hypothetical protein